MTAQALSTGPGDSPHVSPRGRVELSVMTREKVADLEVIRGHKRSSWNRDIAAWREYLVSGGLPETTIGLRTYHLHTLAREVGGTPRSLTFTQLTTWLATKDWKPNTRKSVRSSLRSFYAWALAAQVVDHSPAHLLPPVRPPRSKPRPTPDLNYRAALRDAAPRVRRAVRLGGQCGLRRSEIARVQREDVIYREDDDCWELRVIGKGGHERYVPLPGDLAADLLTCPPGWIFPSSQGGHLTPHHLAKLIKAALDGYTTHTLRHRTGTKSYRYGGKDIRAVQELLGHASIDTTQVYTEVERDAIRAAMEGAA